MVVERRGARALLIADGAVLLIKGFDPAHPEGGTWWLTPGGGIDDGESIEDAAVREVFEETGLQISRAELGPVVATRTASFAFDHVEYHQEEWIFAVVVERFEPSDGGWEEVEQRALLGHRWWTVGELRATSETVYPIELADVVQAVLDGTVDRPMQLSDS